MLTAVGGSEVVTAVGGSEEVGMPISVDTLLVVGTTAVSVIFAVGVFYNSVKSTMSEQGRHLASVAEGLSDHLAACTRGTAEVQKRLRDIEILLAKVEAKVEAIEEAQH